MRTRKETVCEECRSRKLGCDGKQPACSQCLMSGFNCPGYPKQIIFRSPISPGSVERSRRPRSQRARNPAASRRAAPKPMTVSRALAWPLRDVLSLCVQNFVPAGELGLMSNTPDLSQPRICGAWIEVLPGLLGSQQSDDGLLPSAIKALGISLTARGRDAWAPTSDAIAAHSSAIRVVRRTLQQNQDFAHNEMAASIMCLFLSEKLLPTSASASTIHAGGIGELIQLRTPAFYASGIPHRLFVGFRPILILHSFITRKGTFLAESAWRTEPFRIVPADPLQALLNEACVIPSIFEKLDLARTWPSNADSLVEQALLQFNAVLCRLNDWYRITGTTFDAFFEANAYGGTDRYPNISAANSLTHYWAFWIICVAHIRGLRAEFPTLQAQPVLVEGLEPESNAIAQEIARLSIRILASAEYLTRYDMKLYGIASAPFPLQVARSALEKFQITDEDASTLLGRVSAIVLERGYGHEFLQNTSPLII